MCLRPPLALASGPSSLTVTVPTPSDRDRVELLGPHVLEYLLLRGLSLASTAELDARDAAGKLPFGGSAVRYSHADWERKQQVEPTCDTTIQHALLGQPLTLPTETFARFPSRQRPSFSEVQELAGKRPPP